jgi:hypothetical protein
MDALLQSVGADAGGQSWGSYLNSLLPGTGGEVDPNANGPGGSNPNLAPTPAANALTSMAGSSALTWIEELAIRAMLVLVGIVLIAGGLYIAGARSSGNLIQRVTR